jgi:hypothetical protein
MGGGVVTRHMRRIARRDVGGGVVAVVTRDVGGWWSASVVARRDVGGWWIVAVVA